MLDKMLLIAAITKICERASISELRTIYTFAFYTVK